MAVPDIVVEAQEIILKIKNLLLEKPKAVQGWVLADLTAIWLSNQSPDQREKQLEQHMQFVRLLLEHVYDDGEIDIPLPSPEQEPA